MKTIQLQIEDKDYDSFLNIINNLKDGVVKNLKVKDTNDNIAMVSDEENAYYKNLLEDMSDDDKIISSRERFKI